MAGQSFIYPDKGMVSLFLIAGLICVAIWVYLLVGHGHFWRIPLPPALTSGGAERSVQGTSSSQSSVILSGASADVGDAESKDPYRQNKLLHRTVAVVIPARNEADVIGRAVRSLLQQCEPILSPESGEQDVTPGQFSHSPDAPPYSASFGGRVRGWLHIFVVDDNSTDGTADVAREAAAESPGRVTVVTGQPLQPGWSGKLWAVQQGVDEALRLQAGYLLLTDADVEHDSHNVASLIGITEKGGYDLASFMVKLHCRSLAEKLLIPAFVFFFFMLYPPAWICDRRRKTAGAAGGCILIRPAALERIGSLAAIRGELIDDCALARAVKNNGCRVWLGATANTHSVRPYKSIGEIESMISRTAFNQLRHSFWLLLGTIVGMLLIYVLPLTLIASGSAKLALLGAAAVLLMCASYLPMVRFYGLNPAWALTLPFSAAFYTAATLHSAVKYWRGRGGEWKGRPQDRG